MNTNHIITPHGNVQMNFMYFTHSWEDEQNREYFTTRVSLPSGINVQEIDRVIKVTVAHDGMSMAIVIEYPDILTNLNTIQRNWDNEPTTCSLTEKRIFLMVNDIKKDVLKFKQNVTTQYLEKIKGECKIDFDKECELDLVHMCVQHEETHGGFVLCVTTKVRKQRTFHFYQNLKITSIPSEVPFNDNRATTHRSTGTPTNGTIVHDIIHHQIIVH